MAGVNPSTVKGPSSVLAARSRVMLGQLVRLIRETPDALLVVVNLNYEDVSTVFNRDTNSPREWKLDSGSSYHIRPERGHFDEFHETKNETVSLTDGSTGEIKGMGIVKIKIFDRVVRIFDGVRCVPKLRKNVISPGRLASKGYKCFVSGAAMNIKRGRVVQIKGKLRGEIYRLIRSEPDCTGTLKKFVTSCMRQELLEGYCCGCIAVTSKRWCKKCWDGSLVEGLPHHQRVVDVLQLHMRIHQHKSIEK